MQTLFLPYTYVKHIFNINVSSHDVYNVLIATIKEVNDMTDSVYLSDHFHFLMLFIFYFLPALIGSVISFYVKNILEKRKNKKKLETSQTVFTILMSAMAPAIILTSLDNILEAKIEDHNLLIGLGFLTGCIGSEILNTITSFKTLFNLFTVIGSHIDQLKNLADVMKQISDKEKKDDN